VKNPHPNATVAGGTSGAGVALVWLLGYLGVHISAEVAVVIAGAAHSPAVDQPETTADVLAGLWCSVVGDEPDGDEPAA